MPMGLGRRLILAGACALTPTGCYSPPERGLEVEPGQVVVVSQLVQGDIECWDGTLVVLPGATVMGDIVAYGCAVQLFDANSGEIVAIGGPLLFVEAGDALLGHIVTDGVARVTVRGSRGRGFDIERAGQVEIVESRFGGRGEIEDAGVVSLVDLGGLGSLEVDGAAQVSLIRVEASGDVDIDRVDDCEIDDVESSSGSVSAPSCRAL